MRLDFRTLMRWTTNNGYTFIFGSDNDDLSNNDESQVKIKLQRIMMSDEKQGIWNGGKTNITQYDKMIRESEDYYDEVDSETTFRTELQEREKLMKEQDDKNPIRSKFGDYNRRNQINTMMDKPCEISHGDPKNRYRSPEGSEIGKSKDK